VLYDGDTIVPFGPGLIAAPLSVVSHHTHMVALYTVWYNFARQHKTLRVSPAMAAGLSDRLWTMEEVVQAIDVMAPPPGPRGPYKKRW
jgi:hypothetical protein